MTIQVAILLALLIVAIWLLVVAGNSQSGTPDIDSAHGTTPREQAERRSLRFADMIDAGLINETERPIRTKVRGVSFRSQTTCERREYVIQTRCKEGDALALTREPSNSHDPNAVLVCRMVLNEQQSVIQLCDDLGHLSGELAEQIAPRMDNGESFVARISAVTGDLEVDAAGDDGYNAGLNIYIYKVTERTELAKAMAAARL